MKSKVLTFLIMLLMLTACATPVVPSTESDGLDSEQSGKVFVVATTPIIGDVVSNIGGAFIDLAILVPSGVDPHSFVVTPQDAIHVASADILFVNGFEYEDFLPELLDIAGEGINIVPLSEVGEPIDLISFDDEDSHDGEEAADGHEGEDEDAHDHHGSFDPHVWMNPNHIVTWVRNIEASLSEADPANAATYSANADAYAEQLIELDGWIEEKTSLLSPDKRKIVTDHDVLGYYIQRYDFELIGAIIPGYSTISSPSAQEIAQLIEIVREQDVSAIFVGKSANSDIAKQVTNDTGAEFVFIYTEALSAADGPAGTYIDYMRYNTNVIVEALK